MELRCGSGGRSSPGESPQSRGRGRMSKARMRRETEREGGTGKGEGALPPPARVARVLRRIIGAPDYGAYLEHRRTAGHPPRLTEKPYLKEVSQSKGKSVR